MTQEKLYPAHIIFTFKGKVCQSEKRWRVARIEAVLTRMGASHWEIAPFIPKRQTVERASDDDDYNALVLGNPFD